MTQKQKILSVIIPVYNEEKTVVSLLDKVMRCGVSVPLELIIVNDGSTDSSPELIRNWISGQKKSAAKIVFLNKENGGKGSAVKAGIRASTGDVVIIQDADLEYDPRNYEACIRPILDGECKVVYGSREEENRNRLYSSPSFYLGGLLLTFWINLLYHADLTDEPTCYKTFDGSLIRSLPIDGDKFEWEPEVTAKLLRTGFEIREVPVAYYPRKITEGKKIKWKDGAQGLWTAFRWRFASLKGIRRTLGASAPELGSALRNHRKISLLLWSVFFLAFFVRLFFALPSLGNPDLQMRAESDAFLTSANQILKHGVFRARYPSCIAIFPSGTPAYEITSLDNVRAPLYPAWLAVLFKLSSGSLVFCILAGCLLGALIVFPVFFSGRLFGSPHVGLCAGLLFALNPTAVALSPMFLPDTLFAFLVALQGYFFLRFIKSAFGMNLICAILLAGGAALIRPANALWIIPCVIVILFFHKLRAHLKFNYVVISLLLFAGVILPWMFGSHLAGIGWRVDTISSEALLKNASALKADLEGKGNLLTHMEAFRREERKVYAAAPEQYGTIAAQLRHRDRKMLELIFSHPLRYLKLHFSGDSLRRIVSPDFSALFENFNIGRTGNRPPDSPRAQPVASGAFAATAVLYMFYALGLGWFLLLSLDRRHFLYFLILLLLAGYYLFMPGPIAIPRYQLPALPFVCVAAAFGLFQFFRILRRKPLLRGLELSPGSGTLHVSAGALR